MHGLGNDFVLLDARREPFSMTPRLARAIADRHTGVGCDQIVVIEPPDNDAADAFIRFYNSDGSEPEACGNGTRCAASVLLGEAGSQVLTLSTLGGTLKAWKEKDTVMVDMGAPRLDWRDIPLARDSDTLAVPFSLPEAGFEGIAACAGMGNPHATIFVPDVDAVELEKIGPLLERYPIFPRKANIGFAQIVDSRAMRFRVWERGAGVTLCCGSAVCAAVVNAVRRGLTGRTVDVSLQLGSLAMAWRQEDDHVIMGGPAATVFSGAFDPAFFSAMPILQR